MPFKTFLVFTTSGHKKVIIILCIGIVLLGFMKLN